MRRCLIVANQTIGGAALTAAVKDLSAESPTEFVLAVPAVRVEATVAAVRSTEPRSSSVGVEDGSKLAAQRLVNGLDWLAELGVPGTGQVLLGDITDGVAEIVEHDAVDEIIVSTLPKTLSKFLRQDLASKIRRRLDTPVTVVTATS